MHEAALLPKDLLAIARRCKKESQLWFCVVFDDVVLFEKCSLTTSVGGGLSEQSLWDQEGRHQQPLPDQVQTRNLCEIRLEGVASAVAGTNQ